MLKKDKSEYDSDNFNVFPTNVGRRKSKRKIYDYLRKPVIETSWLKGR
ncbi:MAG: hypothetical protein ACLUR5_16320 [Eubacterium ventriosum]